MDDYFVVGPRVELVAQVEEPCQEQQFQVNSRMRPIGVAYISPAANHCNLIAEVPGIYELETLRLLARIAQRFHAALPLRVGRTDLADRLSVDEFIVGANGLWRQPAPFVRSEEQKAVDMEGVYNDPFYIPWNFVPRELDVLRHLFATLPGGELLDLGCGFGKNAVLLEQNGYAVHGIDNAPSAVSRCRELLSHPSRVLSASVCAIPWADASFDIVLDIGCLHCLMSEGELSEACREIARVLRPGGLLLSRSFRPRPQDWVAAQPFHATSFGIEPDTLRSLLAPNFEVQFWREHPDHNYCSGVRRAS